VRPLYTGREGNDGLMYAAGLVARITTLPGQSSCDDARWKKGKAMADSAPALAEADIGQGSASSFSRYFLRNAALVMAGPGRHFGPLVWRFDLIHAPRSQGVRSHGTLFISSPLDLPTELSSAFSHTGRLTCALATEGFLAKLNCKIRGGLKGLIEAQDVADDIYSTVPFRSAVGPGGYLY
jgi:hypothetical protein